jgi:hypothetical protein
VSATIPDHLERDAGVNNDRVAEFVRAVVAHVGGLP